MWPVDQASAGETLDLVKSGLAVCPPIRANRFWNQLRSGSRVACQGGCLLAGEGDPSRDVSDETMLGN